MQRAELGAARANFTTQRTRFPPMIRPGILELETGNPKRLLVVRRIAIAFATDIRFQVGLPRQRGRRL